MRNLNDYYYACMRELNTLGIQYGCIDSIKVNNRAKARWGICKMLPCGHFAIEINSALLRYDVPEKVLKETIIHEMIHTCPGCFNHGAKWKAIADSVNRFYGYNVSRTTSEKEKGCSLDRKPITMKYAIQCPSCGFTHRSSKLTKTIQHPENYRCSVCHVKMIRIL